MIIHKTSPGSVHITASWAHYCRLHRITLPSHLPQIFTQMWLLSAAIFPPTWITEKVFLELTSGSQVMKCYYQLQPGPKGCFSLTEWPWAAVVSSLPGRTLVLPSWSPPAPRHPTPSQHPCSAVQQVFRTPSDQINHFHAVYWFTLAFQKINKNTPLIYSKEIYTKPFFYKEDLTGKYLVTTLNLPKSLTLPKLLGLTIFFWQ